MKDDVMLHAAINIVVMSVSSIVSACPALQTSPRPSAITLWADTDLHVCFVADPRPLDIHVSLQHAGDIQ